MIDANSDSDNTSSNESTNGSSTNGSALKQKASSAKKSADKARSNDSADGQDLLNGMPQDRYKSFRPPAVEKAKTAPMEVVVDHGVERAIKILKRKLIKESLFKELKARRYFTKPSEIKKRKLKESLKKIRKEESRRQKSQVSF